MKSLHEKDPCIQQSLVSSCGVEGIEVPSENRISRKLVLVRKLRKLSHLELATITGVPYEDILRFEAGAYPSSTDLLLFAKTLNLSISYFFPPRHPVLP